MQVSSPVSGTCAHDRVERLCGQAQTPAEAVASLAAIATVWRHRSLTKAGNAEAVCTDVGDARRRLPSRRQDLGATGIHPRARRNCDASWETATELPAARYVIQASTAGVEVSSDKLAAKAKR